MSNLLAQLSRRWISGPGHETMMKTDACGGCDNADFSGAIEKPLPDFQRMFAKSHTGARRFSISRVAAMSSMVSDVCTRYSQSLLKRRLGPSQAKLRSTIQVSLVILEGTLPTFHDLQLPAVLTHEVPGKPAALVTSVAGSQVNSWQQRSQATSKRPPARPSDILASSLGWRPVGPACPLRCGAYAFYTFMPVESACATAFVLFTELMTTPGHGARPAATRACS
jgi:hypothetical protein